MSLIVSVSVVLWIAITTLHCHAFVPSTTSGTRSTHGGILNSHQYDYEYTAEVVGASGRIGSFLLRSGNGDFVNVPRDALPGSLTGAGSPIYVSVPATQVADGE